MTSTPDSRAERREILAICKRIGYGRVMQITADAWAEIDPIGALTVGTARCYAEEEEAKDAQITALQQSLNAALEASSIAETGRLNAERERDRAIEAEQVENSHKVAYREAMQAAEQALAQAREALRSIHETLREQWITWHVTIPDAKYWCDNCDGPAALLPDAVTHINGCWVGDLLNQSAYDALTASKAETDGAKGENEG